MSQRVVLLPEIGKVVLAKRRGTHSLRLSIRPDGSVRVGMPAWFPYKVGADFARSRSDWINKHRTKSNIRKLIHGQKIGKVHALCFIEDAKTVKPRSRIKDSVIYVFYNPSNPEADVQKKAAQASEKALMNEASNLFPARLDTLARRHGFKYSRLKIKKLRSKWGSCTHKGEISLSLFLIQLPWHLIDYVIHHELVHLEHQNHSRDFWGRLEQVSPGARNSRMELRNYSPVIMTTVLDS